MAGRHFKLRRATFALLAMCGGALFGARSASASCGDYLDHRGAYEREAGRRPNMTAASAGERAPQHTPGCRDGSCRSSVPLPAPQPTNVFRLADQWACRPAAAAMAAREWAWTAIPETTVRSRFSREAPLRPPRAMC